MGKKKKLFLIDGSNCFYRAFHAIPEFTNSDGLPTNAVYGFTQTLRKIIKDYEPDYIAVAFDVKGKTVRHDKFEDYKAKRPPMPDSLVPQIPYIKAIVKAFNIAVMEKEGYEADDVIATLVSVAKERGLGVVIVSGDKDLYQLVNKNVSVLDQAKGKEFGPAEVEEKFGVAPGKIKDLLSLSGDSSDNIPGVPGVGPKTAAKLLNEFGSFDAVFENVESVKGKKLKENLTNFKEQAIMSRHLVTLYDDLALKCDMDSLLLGEPDYKELETLFMELDFEKLYKEIIPSGSQSAVSSQAVTEFEELSGLLDKLKGKPVAVTLLTEGNGVSGILKGVTFADSQDTVVSAWFVPIDDMGMCGMEERRALYAMKSLMEDGATKKFTDDAKSLYLYFMRHSVEPVGIEMDTSIASYLLDPSRSDHSIEKVAFNHLGTSLTVLKPPYEDIDSTELAAFASERAAAVMNASLIFPAMLKDEGLIDLFEDMEMPLTGVLARMECAGIKVEAKLLIKLSKEIAKELATLEKSIYALAGCEFNINSPKQLSVVLFETMGIEPVKRTKTGFSTDESVLKRLSENYDIALEIIRHRQLQKLKSTFVDAIVALVNPETGRVHTSFNQTVTATGRLSSSRPNLQNIPIRDEYSSRVREAFVAENGFIFLSADYSQIELRLVAHMSGDKMMIEAFNSGEDIHSITAAEVFGIMPGLVTREMRRRAKAINFGIIYGMGAFGLANDLEITMKDAGEYIESYFAHYGTVKAFINRIVKEASEKGFTTTLFGRKRPITELKSTNNATRKFGERMAINSPVQGTAADMIKVAMIRVQGRIDAGSLRSRMILQVHDELIFECVPEEMERLKEIVIDEMEGVVELKVPVIVNIKTGANWRSVE
ncbi:MAG: DNA polymerase I [Thermodesulfobacteriota bacterium]